MIDRVRDGSPSFMFYCHEGQGLGHLRRTQALGQAFRDRWPNCSQLIVASSSSLSSIALLEEADYIKLPSIRWVPMPNGDRINESRYLPLTPHEIMAMRSDLLLNVVHHFQPDALIVDHAPAGVSGELKPALRHLRESSAPTRLIAGIRDIWGEEPRLRQNWSRDGVYELLETAYDRILVYGQQDVYDLADHASLSPTAAAKVRYVGYLRREHLAQTPGEIRDKLELSTGRLLLGTAGSGSEGYGLLSTILAAIRLAPERTAFDALIVAGPQMPVTQRARLKQLAETCPRVRFMHSVQDLAPYLAAADVVVSQAGYNSVCEILTFERPAILVPRLQINGVNENQEQLMRARATSERGLARMIHPDELTPSRLMGDIVELLSAPSPAPVAKLNLNGLSAATAEIEALLADR